jgi:hypothetical protein
VDGGQPTGAERCSWPSADPLWTRLVPSPEAHGLPFPIVIPLVDPDQGPHTPDAAPLLVRVRGARGLERAGPTRSHPEPGRDPAQRRRVLWVLPTGGEAAASPPDPPHERVDSVI